jgi:energy-coupling factor transporter transmembrane protein EcfT
MAHLLEMQHKMGLSMQDYTVVQTIYRGWAWLGIVQAGAVIFALILSISVRHKVTVFWLSLAAFFCLALTLVLFFSYTYPVNVITRNWTILPENWMQLRQQWEYSHAVSAVLTFIAFILLILAVLHKDAAFSTVRRDPEQ